MADLISNSSAYLAPIDYNNRTTADKARIDALITSASEIIEKYCNRVFASTAYTPETRDGSGEKFMLVANPPIISLTSIAFVSPSDATLDTVTTSGNFVFKSKTGEIQWLPSSTSSSQYAFDFYRGFQNIQINYTGGWADIPNPIQSACADLVMLVFDPTLVPGLVHKEKLGQHFLSLSAEAMMQTIVNNQNILSRYRLRSRQ